MPEKVFIDRDELLEKAKGTDAYFQIKSIVTGLPVVDAVEVVRCKDCVFLERTDSFGDCTLYDEHVSKYPNEFCSDGKRKGAKNG